MAERTPHLARPTGPSARQVPLLGHPRRGAPPLHPDPSSAPCTGWSPGGLKTAQEYAPVPAESRPTRTRSTRRTTATRGTSWSSPSSSSTPLYYAFGALAFS